MPTAMVIAELDLTNRTLRRSSAELSSLCAPRVDVLCTAAGSRIARSERAVAVALRTETLAVYPASLR